VSAALWQALPEALNTTREDGADEGIASLAKTALRAAFMERLRKAGFNDFVARQMRCERAPSEAEREVSPVIDDLVEAADIGAGPLPIHFHPVVQEVRQGLLVRGLMSTFGSKAVLCRQVNPSP
jgi:hypothetical protein